MIRTETDADGGEEATRAIPFMRSCTVFKVEQTDGLPRTHAPSVPRAPRPSRRSETFFAATGVAIRHCGVSATASATT